jgi:probable rRNA maturation factor
MIEYRSFIKSDIKKSVFEKIALFVFKQENIDNADLTLTLVGKARMRTLNRTHRHKDYATDVLSFPNPQGFINPDNNLGDIIICPEETDNIMKIFIHGVLHLLGYSHDTEKNAKILECKQSKYLQKFYV